MKNRTIIHILIMFLIVILTAIAHYSIYYGAMIRGYEASKLGALRDLALISGLAVLPVFIKRILKYNGNWAPYTASVLLLSIGLTVQYRLFSDHEYPATAVTDIDSAERTRIQNSNESPNEKAREMLHAKLATIAQARDAKIKTLQLHYIQENYSPEKKQVMGLPATPAEPVDLSKEPLRPSKDTLTGVIRSGNTLNPIFGIFLMLVFFVAMRRDDTLRWLQANGFLIALTTVVPLFAVIITSKSGKLGGMTPWEPAKIPFLLGFAAILAVLYKNLTRTYWGIPRAKDAMPLVFMAVLPFIPLLFLKEANVGQMMMFGFAYATLYMVAVRRWLQRFVLVGSVMFVMSVLLVGALPDDTQAKIPVLPIIAKPVKKILPSRIPQRFHLWLDGFNPPNPETEWWKPEYDKYYADLVKKDPSVLQLIEEDPNVLQRINVDAWFDLKAYQPAQATFGLSSGGTTGRGLGLGYPELIPVADSDYIFAALAEELGLLGGLLITFALIVFVTSGIRTARDSRDMFSKLCCLGVSALIGFQGLANIGGITRAMPMTGIPLPFVSHGGFSLITSFMLLGMLMAFSHRNAVDRYKDKLNEASQIKAAK